MAKNTRGSKPPLTRAPKTAKPQQLPPAGGRLGDAAESVGAGLGHLLNRVEHQVTTARTQRDAAIKNLLAVRDKATELLADLGHSVTELPVPGLRRKRRSPPKTEGSAVPPAVRRNAGAKSKRATISEATSTAIEAQRQQWEQRKTAKKSGK